MSASVLRQRLASQGVVLLTVTADAFDITPAERAFVFDLVDTLRAYNADHFGLTPPPTLDREGADE